MDAFGGKQKIVVDVVKRRRRVHALKTCAMYRPRLHIGVLLDFPVSKYGKVGVLPSSEFSLVPRFSPLAYIHARTAYIQEFQRMTFEFAKTSFYHVSDVKGREMQR